MYKMVKSERWSKTRVILSFILVIMAGAILVNLDTITDDDAREATQAESWS